MKFRCNRLIGFFLSILLLVAVAASLPADVPTLSLVDRVTLKSLPLTLQKVTREDLAKPWSDVRLERVPDPGQTTTLSRAYIHMKVRQQDFPSPRFRGNRRRTEVHRPGRTLPKADLRRRIKSLVRSRLAGDSKTRVTVGSIPGGITVAPGAYRLQRGPSNPYNDSHVSAWRRYEIVQGDRVVREFRARVTVDRSARVPVAAVPVSRNTRLKKSMIQWKETNVAKLDYAPLRKGDKLVGLVARRSFEPGEIIFRRHLKRPIVIERRQKVTILYRFDSLRVKTTGLALDEGAVGDVISVENLSSEETLNAEIQDGRTVLANYDG